jgi:hypothetical protein
MDNAWAWIIIGGFLVVIGTIMLGYGWHKMPEKNSAILDTANEPKKEATEKKTRGIRAKMDDIISGEFKRLIEKQVDPWIFYNSKGVNLKQFNDKIISMSGGKYDDQSKMVFFGHIEPYIQDVIKRKIEETVELAKDKRVPIFTVLGSTESNLSGEINTVYHKIQIIDRRLRGGGDPESVPKRDVSSEIKKMNGFLDRQIKIAKDLHFEIHEAGEAGKVPSQETEQKEKWYQTNTFKYVVIPLVIALFVGIPAWLSLCNKTDHSPTASTNIFAYVSKDGTILRSNNFPWKICKSNDQDGNVLYTIVDRRGDATAVSVVPDNPKYTVYQSYDGMVIKYTCAEEKIANFTIRLTY